MPADRKVWEVSMGPSNPLGHAKLVVSTSVVDLSSAVDGASASFPPPAGTRRIAIRVKGQPVNYTDFAGQVPSATFGFPLLADETLVYDGTPSLFKVIRDTAATADAELRIAYYGND